MLNKTFIKNNKEIVSLYFYLKFGSARAQCYKTFLSAICNKQQCLPCQAFPAQSNKYLSIVRKLINYGQKSFITKAPLKVYIKRCSSLGQAPGLTHKHYTRLERLARDKHFSTWRKYVNYGRKKVYSTSPTCQT